MSHSSHIGRRQFLRQLMSAASMAVVSPALLGRAAEATTVKAEPASGTTSLSSKWKGFNLLNKFNPDAPSAFSEQDFEIMARWGFNFVRIPLSYWCWSSEADWYHVNDKVLTEIDRAVEFGRQYGMHVNLNFHRVPGYCINPPAQAANLFEDEEPLRACAFHWRMFAERYRHYDSSQLSFNLINEAPSIADEKYEHVARHLIDTIRQVSPDRIIIVDGIDVGGRPLMSLQDMTHSHIIQSGRGYQPMLISHYAANWVYGDEPMYFPQEQLSWPLSEGNSHFDKEWLRNLYARSWAPWTAAGGEVHIGEFGCHNRTPHHVALAWLSDLLDIFHENNWGWSLWNLYGSFGILDSNRPDVTYEPFHGHLLDRRMLDLLLSHL